MFHLYPMTSQTSLFQIPAPGGLSPVTDSRVRKILKHLNINLGLSPAFFTFHIPIKDIKRHGTWSGECVWRYIQSDHTSGEALANALALSINNG